MVHTKSAIAFTVLALGAASTLARPSYEDYSDELALREFEEMVEALAARGVADYDEYDAREFDFDMEDVDARDLEDYDIREIIEEFDVDARELDFGDFEEREYFNGEEDVFERAATTTSASSSHTTPSPTTTTIITKPTGIFGKAKKERKTVVITVHKTPKKCKKPGLFTRIKNSFNKKAKKRSQLRNQKSSTTSAASSTSASSTASATATASSTSTANWAQITPPPRKERGKGVTYSQKKTVGKDKVTTISRTVTAAPSPCPTKDAKKHKRDLDEFEALFERETSFDELD
jgi:hypothetical protein